MIYFINMQSLTQTNVLLTLASHTNRTRRRAAGVTPASPADDHRVHRRTLRLGICMPRNAPRAWSRSDNIWIKACQLTRVLASRRQHHVCQSHRALRCLFLTLTFTQRRLKDDVGSSVHMCEWLQHKAGGHRGLLSASVSVNIRFSSARPMALLNQFPLSVPQRLYNWHLHNLFHLLYWAPSGLGHLAFNLVVSRSLICLTFINGAGGLFQAAPRHQQKYIFSRHRAGCKSVMSGY